METEMGNHESQVLKNTDPDTIPNFMFATQELYKAKIIDVHDGDTCTALIYIPSNVRKCVCRGSKSGLIVKMNIRIIGIDCAEVTGDHCDEYKELACKATELVKSTMLHKVCNIKIVKWDKFGGRVDAEIFTPDTNTSIAQLLLDNELAVEYTGKTAKIKSDAEYIKAVKN